MLRFAIHPLVGLGPISFSTSRAACQAAFGVPSSSRENADFYFGNSLQITFTEEGRIEFVEAARDGIWELVYGDVNICVTPVHDIATLFAREAPYEEYIRRYDSGYIFEQLEIALWRWDLVEGRDEQLESIVIGSKGYFSEQRWLADPGNQRYPSPYETKGV